jgi:RHS repeat-associated protein
VGAGSELDADGFLTKKTLSDGATWKYAWDAHGQLIEVARPDGGLVKFTYDAFGRRTSKTYDGKTTEYLWDGDDLVHERVRGEDGEVASALTTWVFEPGTFTPVAKIEGRKRYGIVTDHLGSPTMLATEAGKIAWKAQLDVYGVPREEPLAGADAAGESERTSNPWRFPGQYEDTETGLYYNRFRYYDPELGRYLSEDPIGLIGGTALYGYVHDPLGWLDALGLSCKSAGRKRMRDLGLGDVRLAGASFNRGRKQLERSGFRLVGATDTGRRVFRNPRTGAEVFFDSGRALAPGQSPHWHIVDRGGSKVSRSGRTVGSDEVAAHLPGG